jgi:hypothetical protein
VSKLPALVFSLLIAQAPGDLNAARHTDPIPAGVAPPVAQKLAPGGTRVNAGTVTVSFWFVSALPLKTGNAAPSWVDVEEGSLIGLVMLDKDVRDIRGKVVRAATYTLRYGIQPANSDHLGVSPYRDFLLLSPVAEDLDPAPRGHDGTVDLSKHTIGGSHPAVWSIDPPAATDALSSTHTTDLGHKAVIVEVPTTREGNGSGPLRFGIVLIGKIEA